MGHFPFSHPLLSFYCPPLLLQAARLCFQVVGGNRTRDTRKKSLRKSISKGDEKKGDMADQPLHWVNMQILDHR